MKIRNETAADVVAIDALTVAAFRNAPHTSHTEQFIVHALRNAGALAASLVAECDGAIVGHVALSPVTISNGTSDWYGLGPISVLPERQGEGIGSALMDAALAALRDLSAAGCVVLGDPAFYSRFGFMPEAGLVLLSVPAEYFMALALDVNLPQGSVSYHAAFEAKA